MTTRQRQANNNRLDIWNIPDAVMQCIHEDRTEMIKNGYARTTYSGAARAALIVSYEANSRIWRCGVCGGLFHASVESLHDVELGDICAGCHHDG